MPGYIPALAHSDVFINFKMLENYTFFKGKQAHGCLLGNFRDSDSETFTRMSKIFQLQRSTIGKDRESKILFSNGMSNQKGAFWDTWYIRYFFDEQSLSLLDLKRKFP